MRNIVGQTPRGKNFFIRENLMKLLYRRMDSGANLYIAAPRRMGKTAILRYLEDNPKDAFNAVYVITESVDNAENFFKTILDELFKSDIINTLKRASNKASELIDKILRRFKKVGGFGVDLELADSKTDFYNEFKMLVKKLDDTDGLKIVIMIDEFPQTVENIFRKSGKDEAIRFLQLNREIRQEATENILFILTGSIGLPTLAEKIDASNTINDLNIFEITPLETEEAKQFTFLLLDNEKVPYEPEAIDYMLKKLEWFSPYHIQLLVQEFADQYGLKNKTVSKSSVDEAFSAITDRRNDANFAHYFERLKKTFTGHELEFASEFLKQLSRQAESDIPYIEALATQKQVAENYRFIIRSLEFDGYIFRNSNDKYRFTSPVLRLWWEKYVI